jgi:hypothetical protein
VEEKKVLNTPGKKQRYLGVQLHYCSHYSDWATPAVPGSILEHVRMLLVQNYSSTLPSVESNTYFRKTIEAHYDRLTALRSVVTIYTTFYKINELHVCNILKINTDLYSFFWVIPWRLN